MTIVEHSSALAAITSKWFNNQTTSDLQVRLKDDRVLFCHRLVLTSWSEVWAAALQDEKETCLDLTSHEAVTVEMCVKYCYTSTIDLTDDNVTQVHLFVHQYDLKELRTTCEQRIVQSMSHGLSASNCMGLYGYLAEHKFPGLPDALQSIKEFVCREFVPASKSYGFLRLSVEVLCQLLKEEELNTTEDGVLDACLRWLDASPVGSDPQVRERVLQLVRFPMLSAKKLLEFNSHPLMSQCDSLRSRHHFALQWVVTNQVGSSEQEPLRIKLKEENKTEIFTPRIPFLQIKSQILDADMTKTLSSMLGSKFKVGQLLVNSTAGTTREVFENAVTGKGQFVCIIKSTTGHVFGGYVEDTYGGPGGWVPGSPNNFLFSLKNIPPQKVVKLKRTATSYGIHITNYGLHMGDNTGNNALVAFSSSHSTADSPAFELAPGYESVGSRTLHGAFGHYTPEFMEVFALSS